MNIRVSGKQIEIGQALPQRVRDRLTAAVAKHFDRPAQANVTFMKERTGYPSEFGRSDVRACFGGRRACSF
jgi:ribosome-associated translation inhibitor RaiA